MTDKERKLIQDLFLRVCRDCRYTMDAVRVAHFVAGMLKTSALLVWVAMPSFNVMEEIAAGTHPACKRTDI